MITFENKDCMEAMKDFPNNFFDLAIVDPPYGDGLHAEGGGGQGWFAKYNMKNTHTHTHNERKFERFGQRFDRYKRPAEDWTKQDGGYLGEEVRKKIIAWDIAPPQEYFTELFRISRNQIIWGGNYFDLPPTRCFLIWRKLTISESFSMAMCEYAWTSFNSNAKVFECAPQGRAGDVRFHPTQKPIELYKWILSRYAKQGDKILDTHVGSASSLIACYDMGFDAWGYEIDKEYYNKASERLNEVMAQIRMEF